MIHVSSSCNPNFHHTGAHYINADTTAFMQLIQGDLFKDFPTLRFVIPHGGGAVPYHWGRYRGLCPEHAEAAARRAPHANVFFDTCVYHLPGIELLTSVVPIDNVLFASEMKGAVPGIDPETGHYFDDTKRYIDQVQALDDGEPLQDLRGQCPPRLPTARRAADPPRQAGSPHLRLSRTEPTYARSSGDRHPAQ
jgi:4-oxalmesaconate hydratase